MSLLDVWTWFLVLGTLALFAFGIWVLLRLAARHSDDDPGAMAKVAVGVVFSVLLGVGGVFVLHHFEDDARAGMHHTLITGFATSLNSTIGESDYTASVQTVAKKIGAPSNMPDYLKPELRGFNATLEAYLARHPETNASIPNIILPQMRAVNATLAAFFAANPGLNETSPGLPAGIKENLTARADKLKALTAAYTDLLAGCSAANPQGLKCARELTPNHALWVQLQPLLAAGRDAEAEDLVNKAIRDDTVTQVLPLNEATAASNEAPCARDGRGFCTFPLKAKAIKHEFFDAHEVRSVPVDEGGPAAFGHQREFNSQMEMELLLFSYPGITGLVMAPLIFAGGAILHRAYVPSDTVGFRPYPSKAGGFFLLFLGLFSLVILGLPLVLGTGEKPTPPLDLFGILAIPLAAWMLRDLHKRSVEGQIAL